MKRRSLLLLALIVILCLVVGTYGNVPKIVRQLRSGEIDGAGALRRVIGAMVKVADDIIAHWGPIEKRIGGWIDRVQGEVIEYWVRATR